MRCCDTGEHGAEAGLEHLARDQAKGRVGLYESMRVLTAAKADL